MVEEVWESIPDCVGYEASNLGRIRSVDRVLVTKAGVRKRKVGQVLRPGTGSNGYQVVVVNGRSVTVHSLVARTFLGPRPEGADIRHWPDTDKSNNRPENLSYGTRRQNILDAVESGTWNNRNTGKTECIRGHAFTPENTYKFVRNGKTERQCNECRRTYRARRRAQV